MSLNEFTSECFNFICDMKIVWMFQQNAGTDCFFNKSVMNMSVCLTPSDELSIPKLCPSNGHIEQTSLNQFQVVFQTFKTSN